MIGSAAWIGYDPTALKRRGAKTLPVIVVTSNSERRKQEDISEVSLYTLVM